MQWFKRTLAALVSLYLLICIGIYFFQERLLFHPQILPQTYRYHFQSQFEEFNLPVPNGCMINALHFYADSPARGVVLYFHGNGGSLDLIGDCATTFTSRGYDCIMMDYPGYGKSTGKLSEENLFNTGKVFIDYTKKHYSSGRIIIYGRSMGTGIATFTARYSAWFKALILESPYYSITDMAHRLYPWLPVGLLCRYPVSTYRFLQDIHHPVYAIHGMDDQTIPIASPRRFLDLHLPDFTFIEVPGAHHADLGQYPLYNELLDKVLN